MIYTFFLVLIRIKFTYNYVSIMSKSKKIMFFSLFVLFLLIIFEIFSYLLFHSFNYDEKFNLYKEKRNSNLNFKYFKDVNLALPIPEIEVVHYTSEFVDRYKTKDVLNLGFGLFDDGINKEKKYFAVALGDSFTKGVGSGNNIKNGWVELVEKNLPNLDILNLGNLGRSIVDQRYGYDQIKNEINHDFIIYNFFTGGDYYENTTDISSAYFLNNKISTQNLNDSEIQKTINNLQIYHGYDPSFEYILDAEYRLYSLWILIKVTVITNIYKNVPNKFLPIFFKKPLKDFNEYNKTRMNVVPNNIYNLSEDILKSSESIIIDDRLFHVKHIYKNKDIVNKIVDNSANLLKEFILTTKKNNKNILVIIHPSQNDIFKSKLQKKINIDYTYMRHRLIDQINNHVKVLDLTPILIKEINLNEDKNYFWKKDGHYTTLGYKVVSEEIEKFLSANIN